jgi:hypothetical protein
MMEANIQDDGYMLVDEIIHYKDMIYLFLESTLNDRILRTTHNSPLAGHQGYLKTYRKVRERFTWNIIKGDVLRNVRECMTLQQNKLDFTHPAELQQPLLIPR